MEGGLAIADILCGDVNPSGKLVDTCAKAFEDYPSSELFHECDDYARYTEDIYVGYRWAEKQQVKPLFAFGHGLSYTDFTYGDAKVSKNSVKAGADVSVSVNVTNTGKVAGKEVVQLYIGDEQSRLERPVKELKGFSKIALEPGETKTVTFSIDPEKLMYFDDEKHEWVLEDGKFTAYVGSASDDIRTQVSFEVR